MLSTESSALLERQILSAIFNLIQTIEERRRSPIRSSLRRWSGMMLMGVAFFLGVEMLLSSYAPEVLNRLLLLLPFAPLITEILFFSFPVFLLVIGYRAYYYASDAYLTDVEEHIAGIQEDLYPHPEMDEIFLEAPRMENTRTDLYEPPSLPEEPRDVLGREMSR